MYYSYSEDSKRATIYLKVKASARKNLIENFVHIEDKFLLKVSINAVAEDGKANKAIIKFLAKAWHLSQDQLELMKGHNNNIKLLAIQNISKLEIENLISHYA